MAPKRHTSVPDVSTLTLSDNLKTKRKFKYPNIDNVISPEEVMAPKRHTSVPDVSTLTLSDNLKTKRKFKYPNMDNVISDPELDTLFKKIYKDPACRRMRKQMKYLDADSTSKKFNWEIYVSAAKEYLNNTELMNGAARIRKALAEDPSKPGEDRDYSKFAPAFSDILKEIKEGGHAVRVRYYTEPDSFRKFVEAIKLNIQFGTASPEEVTSLNEVETPGDVKEPTVDHQKIHDDTEEGSKNTLDSDIENMEVDPAGRFGDDEDWLKRVNLEDPFIKSWIRCANVVGAHESPLHHSAFYGRKFCVEYFLENGADALLKNTQGYLPIELAKLSKSSDVVELLDKHMKTQIGV